MQWRRTAKKAEGRYQAYQAKTMVAMQMGYKNTCNLGKSYM